MLKVENQPKKRERKAKGNIFQAITNRNKIAIQPNDYEPLDSNLGETWREEDAEVRRGGSPKPPPSASPGDSVG